VSLQLYHAVMTFTKPEHCTFLRPNRSTSPLSETDRTATQRTLAGCRQTSGPTACMG